MRSPTIGDDKDTQRRIRRADFEGNLAGYAGPCATGHIKDVTGSYTGELLSLATAGLTAILIVLVLEHDHLLECVARENLAA